jgi:beta-aspartyl-peptidase (threonine type)
LDCGALPPLCLLWLFPEKINTKRRNGAAAQKPERPFELKNTMNTNKTIANLLACFVVLGSSGFPPGSAHLTAKAAGDESAAAKKAVQQVLDAQAAAWNKGDLEEFMKGYWKSPDLMFFSGKDKTRGWQATIDRYRKRYQAEGRKMGKLTFSEVEIEVLSPASAWVRGRWQVVRDKETLTGLFTLIFKKTPEGWRIVHDHTSAG